MFTTSVSVTKRRSCRHFKLYISFRSTFHTHHSRINKHHFVQMKQFNVTHIISKTSVIQTTNKNFKKLAYMYIYNLCLSAAGTEEISRVLYHKKLLVAQVPIFTLKQYTTLYRHTNRGYPTVPWQTLSSNYFSQIPQYIMYYT